MEIKNQGDIKIIVDPRMELLFAIHALVKRTDLENEDFDWVECPNIPYFHDLTQLIPMEQNERLINYVKGAWDSCDFIPNLATVFDYNFDLKKDRVTDKIRESFLYGTIEEFACIIKKLSEDIQWLDFLESKKSFYSNLVSLINFPKELSSKDIVDFYGYSKSGYNYVVTVLINGGFGIEDSNQELYCIRGFEYDEEKQIFFMNLDYTLENMFHEYSHSYINPLIDENEVRFTNLEAFFQDAIKHNLFKTYSGNPKTLLYEYFVRANATVLASKYTHKAEITPWIKEHGFHYLQGLTDCILSFKDNYASFSELFHTKLIDYINSQVNHL